MDTLNYFLKRLLLIIPTFLGITFICFALCLFLPGGPVEQKVWRSQQQGGEGAGGGSPGSQVSARLPGYHGE